MLSSATKVASAIGDVPPYVAIKAPVVTTFLDSNSIHYLREYPPPAAPLPTSPKMPGASPCQWNAAVPLDREHPRLRLLAAVTLLHSSFLGQRKIRVLPHDQDDGGDEFRDDREANEPDETRILTHQRFGANEDRDMDQWDGKQGRRCRRRCGPSHGCDI